MSGELDIETEGNDLDRTHRIGSRNRKDGKSRAIIVKFTCFAISNNSYYDYFPPDLSVSNSNKSCFFKAKSFGFHNSKNAITDHLNINSLRSKFELLKPLIFNAFDIFLVSETKSDSSFPNNQFCLAG